MQETLTSIKFNKKTKTEILKYESPNWRLFDIQLNLIDLLDWGCGNLKKEIKDYIINIINYKFNTLIYNIKIDWKNSKKTHLIIYCYRVKII